MKDIGVIIYLILIIFGIVNSFLKKNKKDGKPQPKPQARPVPRKPISSPQESEEVDVFGEEIRKILTTLTGKVDERNEDEAEDVRDTQVSMDNYVKRFNSAKDREEMTELYKIDDHNLGLTMDIENEGDFSQSKKMSSDVKINIEEEDWRKSLILSEILNKPKFQSY
jgi:hypothetical protein